MDKKSVEQVLKEHQDELFSIEGVEGFYQGLDEAGESIIVIMIEESNPRILKAIPDSLGGYPVSIESGGKIEPLPKKRKHLPEE
jgi:hypothetical protein